MQIVRERNKEGSIALRVHFYTIASVASNLNMVLLKLFLSNMYTVHVA